MLVIISVKKTKKGSQCNRNGENHMILHSVVLSRYQHVTDRQTDRPIIAKLRSSIGERDNNNLFLGHPVVCTTGSKNA